jgi:hypothetical protein
VQAHGLGGELAAEAAPKAEGEGAIATPKRRRA